MKEPLYIAWFGTNTFKLCDSYQEAKQYRENLRAETKWADKGKILVELPEDTTLLVTAKNSQFISDLVAFLNVYSHVDGSVCRVVE